MLLCTDCAMLAANGERPADPVELELLGLVAPGESVAMACTGEDGDDDATGHMDFSWSPCGGCGSTLGGSRCPAVIFPAVAL